MKKNYLKKNGIGFIFYWLLAILLVFLFLYPIYFVFVSSLKDNNEIWHTMFKLPEEAQWSNFQDAIFNVGILRSVLNSFVLSAGATLVIIVIGTMGAYPISRRIIMGAKQLKLYYLLGLMVPAYGMLIPMVRLFTQLGLRDKYIPMILLYAGINFPISMYLIIGYLDSVSREIDEAALIDGCTVPQTLFRIIFPLCGPGISTAGILTFLNVYNELVFANTLLQRKSMMTISVTLLGLKGERFTSWGVMFAAIVLSILPILIVYLLMQEKIEAGVTNGAVKG